MPKRLTSHVLTAPFRESQPQPSLSSSSSSRLHYTHRHGGGDDNRDAASARTSIRAMTRAVADEVASIISSQCCVTVFMLIGSLGAAGYVAAHSRSSVPVKEFFRYFLLFFFGVPVLSAALLATCYAIYCVPFQ